MDNRIFKIALSRLRGITAEIAESIRERLGSEEPFFTLPREELVRYFPATRIGYTEADLAKALDEARREADFIAKNHIKALYYFDEDYPQPLRVCPDAPLILYMYGNCDLNGKHCVAIVGTRHATAYGTNATARLVKDLAKAVPGLVIVSGLAYGIDIAAHRAALEADIPTVAILANPLNTIYPTQHRNDAAKIARQSGALITEYASGDAVHRGNFLARNRIIAGLSDCVVIAESASHGGAMVTAKQALAYSREVMAFPGRATDLYSAGCNKLIAGGGARLITGAEDLIGTMEWGSLAPEGAQQSLSIDIELSPEETSIVNHLRAKGESTMSELCAATGLNMTRLNTLLQNLDMSGVVNITPANTVDLL